MIPLHPVLDVAFDCPACGARLTIDGWHMPGMRPLARLTCPSCQRHYFGDLPTGQAIWQTCLLDISSGVVHAPFPSWFADELRTNFAAPRPGALVTTVEQVRPFTRGVILNCLDTFYGHSLEKLLNAQRAIDAGHDLLIIVPSFLRWLVPEGAAEIWTVRVRLREGAAWDETFAAAIHARAAALESCALLPALAEPDADTFRIERFTRIAPFDLALWLESSDRPVVSYIWRDDRVWAAPPIARRPGHLGDLARAALRRLTVQRVNIGRVIGLEAHLRRRYPTLDFAVVGMGAPGGLPASITDLRTPTIDDATEQAWCARYARSHVVVGVHGSNMLLPSALAGGVVEILEPGRDGNIGQDLLLRPGLNARQAMTQYRFIDATASAARAAHAVGNLIDLMPIYHVHYGALAKDSDWVVTPARDAVRRDNQTMHLRRLNRSAP